MTSPAGYDEFQAAGGNLSEQQLWSVAMRAPVMLWLANPEGESVFYNETWQAFIGDDSKGSPGDMWYRALHPEDKQRVLDTFADFLDGIIDLKCSTGYGVRIASIAWCWIPVNPITVLMAIISVLSALLWTSPIELPKSRSCDVLTLR